MAMRKILTRGMDLNRQRDIECTEIYNETEELLDERNQLINELGKKFESDKIKLENEIEKINATKVLDDKPEIRKQMVEELNIAIEKLQEQYNQEVTVAEEQLQEEIQKRIEGMDGTIEELDQQADSLREVSMDVSLTNASGAADVAENRKHELEQKRKEYVERLQHQMEQADMLRRNILARRLGGSD